jgi:hypothetical protein
LASPDREHRRSVSLYDAPKQIAQRHGIGIDDARAIAKEAIKRDTLKASGFDRGGTRHSITGLDVARDTEFAWNDNRIGPFICVEIDPASLDVLCAKHQQSPGLDVEVDEASVGASCATPQQSPVADSRYHTELQVLLDQAIEHFGITNSKQPPWKILVDWFQQQGVSERLAKAMATIVRLQKSRRGATRKKR